MQVDERSFRDALSCFASGVAVVTAVGEGGAPVGMTVSSFTSVSLAPPLILVCLDKRARFRKEISRDFFVVNILAENQKSLSVAFAADVEDRFERVAYAVNARGVPVLSGCLAVLHCRVETRHEGGDHWIVVACVESVTTRTEARPLLYFQGGYASLLSGEASAPKG